ncbi:MAG: Lysine--tRNA ligase [Candidatus Omnitrophica bacterium]|nr:Lysine--tRNA ligase [Candidatus Omnitrophota bacterium]
MNEINDLVKDRLRKLDALRAAGWDVFGRRFDKTPIGQLVEGYEENKSVRTAGRLTAMRVMGKSTFADLRDETGRIQVYLKKDELEPALKELVDNLDLGDIVGVSGELFKTRTGEISVRARQITPLAKSVRPMPEKWHGLKDVELRHRHRYLDLMANEETREIFRKRSRIIRSVRRTLDEEGYLEVETPMMHPIPGGAAGKPFKTHHEALDMPLFLRVAPELYLKRLLVGGYDRVYEINKSFRNEGISTRHNPEFTMLEVYTAYHDVEDVMALTERIVRRAAEETLGTLVIESEGRRLDLSRWERVSFAKLMKERLGILPDDETAAWVDKLKKRGIDLGGNKEISRTQVINIVADLLDSELKTEGDTVRPVFVTDYFTELCPLAKKKKDEPLISERFELYVGGMEVANGYSELNDPLEQRERLMAELADKGRQATADTLDEDFIYALEHGMPPAGGLGIGIDRLVMVLTGQASIREVILFPQLKNERVRSRAEA